MATILFLNEYDLNCTVPPEWGWDLGASPTQLPCNYACSSLPENDEDDIKQRIWLNAVKATETIVGLMRGYKRPVYRQYESSTGYVPRAMNSLSGWVPKKLKQKKGRE